MSSASEKRLAALEAHVRSLREGRWLVLTHDNPDPDAIAAAVAITRLLRKAFRRKVTVAYGGIIGRAENRELVRAIKFKLSRVRHISWKHYDHFALVDTQPRTGNNQLPEDVVPDVVLDHHPVRKASRAVEYVDIRPDYGATATIATEYLLASGIDISARDATALVYAIRTETQEFGRESSGPDKEVYDTLFPKVDKRALARIQNPRLPLAYFATLHEALERLEGVDNLILSHLGDVHQPDIVPEVADLLLRLEGKTWSFCSGRFEERLYMSIRTTNNRADAGNMMRRIIGRQGRGGGHGMTAGGWVETGDRSIEEVHRDLGRKLAGILNRDPDKIAPIVLDDGAPKA